MGFTSTINEVYDDIETGLMIGYEIEETFQKLFIILYGLI